MADASRPSAPSIEAALSREILASELLRSKILASLFAIFLVGLTLVYLVSPAAFRELFQGSDMHRFTTMLLLIALGFELLVCWRLGRHVRRGTAPHPLAPYLVTLVETSIPTLVQGIMTQLAPLDIALSLPATLLYFPFILLSTLRLRFLLSLFTGMVAGMGYLAIALIVHGTGDEFAPLTQLPVTLWKVFIYVLSGAVAGLVALQIRKQYERSLRFAMERNRVVEVFGKHVSPQVAEQLLEQNVPLGGEVRTVCVMFLDIRDFTARSSGQQPEEVVSYLNSLFDFMIESVTRHGGIVNKFLGDGFMAIFGAPLSDGRDSANAIAAGREILTRLDEFNRRQSGPPTRIGIGLHTGPAVAGTIGSARRREYTIIGDTVNLASRIESLNKQYDSRLLCSRTTWMAAGAAVGPGESLGEIEIRGEPKPVAVYRLA